MSSQAHLAERLAVASVITPSSASKFDLLVCLVIYERILQNSTEYEVDLKYFYLFKKSPEKPQYSMSVGSCLEGLVCGYNFFIVSSIVVINNVKNE